MRIIKLLNSACFQHAIETLNYTYDDPTMWHIHYNTLKVSNSILIHPLFMVWMKTLFVRWANTFPMIFKIS